MEHKIAINGVRRIILVTVGSLCVGVGTVGIFVPGLPTTVFLLAASWCFAQSSPRLRRWLHDNRHLGAYLRLAGERTMPLRARVISLVGIWGGIGFALVWGGVEAAWAVAVLVIAGVVGSAVVISRRRQVRERFVRTLPGPEMKRSSCPTASLSTPTISPTRPNCVNCSTASTPR